MMRDNIACIVDSSGKTYPLPDGGAISYMISSQIKPLDFKVKYVGQAYRKDGSRNAIHRLQEHATLQKIAIKHENAAADLQLILVELSENRIITEINPFALQTDEALSKSRIKNAVSSLREMTEKEKVSLYEAAMIRYFRPEYNNQLKENFPSTNMRFLNDCYQKDVQGIIAEFCIDEFPYRLFSDNVAPSIDHIAQFDLHTEEDRKNFFARFSS